MIEDIKKLIKEEKYEAAADLAEQEIHRIETGDLITRLNEHYNELIGLRISANTLAKKTDDLILYSTWKHKYPHTERIDFYAGGYVVLTDENISFLHSDAYINSIHAEKKFDYNPRSFSNTILKHIGQETINDQLRTQEHPKHNYYIVQHEIMSAPYSYNIPAIEGDENVNMDTLRNGLYDALQDAKKKKLSSISIAAMGMEIVPGKELKEEIIKTIADTLEKYFEDSKNNKIPVIYFPFITVSSYNAFSEVFKRYSEKGKYFSKYYKELSDTQKELRQILRTTNPYLIKMIKSLSYVINSEENILFLGESGTGKSYLAEELHNLSIRRDKPFKSINCAQVTPEQLFTLVFGWGKDVFEVSPKGGQSIFEAAEGGTVFLDEIGYTNLSFQKSMLAFLDKGRYNKLGEKTDYQSNVRIIFGTNQNLERLIEKGDFIHDLYERLSASRVFQLIPLRERKEDLDEILITELNNFNKKHDSKLSFEKKTLKYLASLNWPGNYRQLLYYIQKKFHDLLYQGKQELTMDMIKEDPPRNHSLVFENDAERVENVLSWLLKNWNYSEHGAILEEVIKPILAKLYLIDYKAQFNKTEASKIIGIDGDRAGSPVEKYFAKYERIKEIFK